MFMGETGERLLVASDDFPLMTLCTSDEEQIEQYLEDCFVNPL